MASAPTRVKGSRAGVPIHHTTKVLPVSAGITPTMNAPAAAGLKTCRPRIASRYFVAVATTAASASTARPPTSSVGWKMNRSSNAVITIELSCGRRRKTTPNTPFAMYDASSSTAALASSGSGCTEIWPSSPRTSAATPMRPRQMMTSAYIVTRPRILSSQAVMRTPLRGRTAIAPRARQRTF
jgi:hypothetical protein